MPTPKVLILAAAAAVALLAQAADAEAGSRKHHRYYHSNRGEHYDTVMGNYIRRCTDLSTQFEQARADLPASPQLAQATALYDRGVSHCEGGARLQGIDELNAALRQLGAIPRVTL